MFQPRELLSVRVGRRGVEQSELIESVITRAEERLGWARDGLRGRVAAVQCNGLSQEWEVRRFLRLVAGPSLTTLAVHECSTSDYSIAIPAEDVQILKSLREVELTVGAKDVDDFREHATLLAHILDSGENIDTMRVTANATLDMDEIFLEHTRLDNEEPTTQCPLRSFHASADISPSWTHLNFGRMAFFPASRYTRLEEVHFPACMERELFGRQPCTLPQIRSLECLSENPRGPTNTYPSLRYLCARVTPGTLAWHLTREICASQLPSLEVFEMCVEVRSARLIAAPDHEWRLPVLEYPTSVREVALRVRLGMHLDDATRNDLLARLEQKFTAYARDFSLTVVRELLTDDPSLWGSEPAMDGGPVHGPPVTARFCFRRV